MASDVRIWTGTAWESIKGTNGAPGPSAVSTNAGQLAKLGTDNLILVASADLDARYVNITGDTMTGALTATAITSNGNAVVGTTAAVGLRYLDLSNTDATLNSGSIFRLVTRNAANTANTTVDLVKYNSGGFTIANNEPSASATISFFLGAAQKLRIADAGVTVTGNLTATGSVTGTAVTATGGRSAFNAVDEAFAIGVRYNAAGPINYIGTNAAGSLQISSAGGAPILTISSTGNISNTGTAHSFAAGSIPVAAINGLPAAIAPSTTAGLADTASGTVGTSAAYARADHTHPGLGMALYTASKVLDATDIGKMIINYSTGATGVTFTLPGDTVMPVGTKVEFYDGSKTALTFIAPQAGQSLNYSSYTASGAASGTANNGPVMITAGSLRMATPYSRLTAIKTQANTWILFSN